MNILSSRRKWLVLLAGGMSVIALLAFALWRVFSPVAPPVVESTAEAPFRFEYCGAELIELCILSFGRDADGNAIINFFAPRDFPDFYLNIQRFDGEITYVCMQNKDVPTSVVCMGDVIHLNERIEVNVMAADDYRLLARGRFTVTALLISTQAGDMQESVTTATPSPSATEPSYPVGAGETATPTPTSNPPSYPSYP